MLLAWVYLNFLFLSHSVTNKVVIREFLIQSKLIQIKFICLFINYNTITNYILIIYELSNLDHTLGLVSGGNRTHAIFSADLWQKLNKRAIKKIFKKICLSESKLNCRSRHLCMKLTHTT